VRGAEGTFSACSFWYVEARLAFEKMLTYANHVGLYAEQISRAGQQQGNFPQALTHLALISAAFNLDRARVNHQDLVTTAHPPGGEARFVAKGSHGHEGAPGNTRRSEPPVNPARFTYMSKEKSGGVPNGITTCGCK
jgi:glycosyl hydrolase family 15